MQLISIRPFRDDEMTAIHDMRRAMTLELDAKDLDADGPIWRKRFAAFVDELRAKDQVMFFMAEAGNQLVGMGGVYILRNHRSEIYGKPSAYVTSIYVKPEHRRQGIATRITQAAVEWASAHNCVVVRLRASDSGRRVYELLGFTPTDEMELPLKH